MNDTTDALPDVRSEEITSGQSVRFGSTPSFGPWRRATAAVIALAGAGLASGAGFGGARGTAGAIPFPTPGPMGR